MNRSIISLLSLILLFGAGCDKGNEVIDDKDIKFDTLDVNYGDLGELETGEVCQSGCLEEWKKECSGSGYHVCQDEDDDGCFEWSAVIKCEPGKVCKEGECVPACADQECTAVGAHKCGENNVVLECGDYDGDGCLEWGNPVKCDEKLVCSQGYCSVSCKSECTFIGAKKCEGNDVVTCGDYNTDGCLEWGDAQDCGNLVCTNGFCKSTCEDECTVVESQKCEGNGYKICNDYNSDGCLEWGTVKNCGQNQTCSNGFCKDQCESECTAIGGKKCELNAVVVCNDYNGDGCLEWGTPLQCDEKLVCNEGYCESQCTSECTIMMAKKCDEGGNVVMCGEYDGDECLEWGSPVPCSDPYVCSEGNCSLECKDECSVKNEKKCVIGVTKSYQICDDYNKDGCLEWGTAIECEGELVCSDGNCALSCQSECAVANTKKCSGNAYQICGDYNGDTCLEWGTEVYCKVYESCDNGTCKQKQPPAEIVISEVLYDSAGSDANTFVELHGPPSTNLAGYSLVGINGNGGSEYNVIELSGTTGSDGLFLVASPTSESWIKDQADLIDAKTDYENGPDNIQLRYGSIVVDAVGYGVFSDADVFKGEGNPAPDVNYDHSIGRDENYTDTNNNANDFSDYATPSPGAANIKINEAPVAKIVCPVSGNTGENLEFDGSQSYD
ncbi:MAG: hypothetical protein FJ088_00770, partial [Deltaproteobacteria bacterium]|nr:hypothetical protein [Deltaproteobacteria bacterium]